MTIRILVANGVNLDLLGERQPEIYGSETLQDLTNHLQSFCKSLADIAGVGSVILEIRQSNCEATFLGWLSEKPAWDGFLINAGAWTHTSLALGDRLSGLNIPFVEVHLSNLARREPMRHHSFAAPHALGVVYGMGFQSYVCGLLGLLLQLQHKKPIS